jgi:hypothetical protein
MYRGNTETDLTETAYEDVNWFIIGCSDGMLKLGDEPTGSTNFLSKITITSSTKPCIMQLEWVTFKRFDKSMCGTDKNQEKL